MMSDQPALEDPPAAPPPVGGARRLPRAVPSLVLLALLLMAAAGGVRAVAHRLNKQGGAGGLRVANQQAVDTAYAQEFRIPYPSLFDPGAQTATTLRAFALPTTFILDHDGVVAYQLTGKTSVPILAARLDTLLAR